MRGNEKRDRARNIIDGDCYGVTGLMLASLHFFLLWTSVFRCFVDGELINKVVIKCHRNVSVSVLSSGSSLFGLFADLTGNSISRCSWPLKREHRQNVSSVI